MEYRENSITLLWAKSNCSGFGLNPTLIQSKSDRIRRFSSDPPDPIFKSEFNRIQIHLFQHPISDALTSLPQIVMSFEYYWFFKTMTSSCSFFFGNVSFYVLVVLLLRKVFVFDKKRIASWSASQDQRL